MKVLVTGSRGYIGIPLMYELSKTSHDTIGIDNDFREEWVIEVTGRPREDLDVPLTKFIFGDLSNKDFVYDILNIHKPDVVIHLASQPSMPYSQLSGNKALFTQANNIAMCVNLLWGIHELGLTTRFIITTTTGIPGQTYKVIPEEPVMNQAGSWYHVSRGFDSANCALAAKQWGQSVLELRTSIVYGVQTVSMRNGNITTRFDTDPYFGTALNRFVNQAIEKQPLTVYGKGQQTKPFISLEDTVASLINAIDYPVKDKHSIFNQVTEHISIDSLAKLVAKELNVKVIHVKNPRAENETFHMQFKNKKFLKLLGKKFQCMEDEIPNMIATIRGSIWKSTNANRDGSYTFIPQYELRKED